MEKVILNANVRNKFSKSSRTVMRKNGIVPGIFYTKNVKPIPVEVPEKLINPLVFTTETHLINLKLDSKQEFDCILKDIQFDPVTDKIIHFDLLGLIKGQAIEIEIPVIFNGSPVGVKEGGQLQVFLHKLTCYCMPDNIPEHLEINITDLKIGHSIHVNEISFENLKILNPASTVIVGVTPPKGTKEAEPGTAEEKAEPEVIAKGKEKQEEE